MEMLIKLLILCTSTKPPYSHHIYQRAHVIYSYLMPTSQQWPLLFRFPQQNLNTQFSFVPHLNILPISSNQ